ncbi:hypothetical protein S40288_09863 [Stachybotrys chartarum IBT 40288]|nr:hypothetical protein S40288_09863 [Stachybotrys chartarum IBT 40288]
MQLFLLFGYGALASAYTGSNVPADCDILYQFTGDNGLEAPTKVIKVTSVAANATTGVPAHCYVEAQIDSLGGTTNTVTYLPARGEDWVGTFVSSGCGGSCGATGLDYIYGYGSPLGYGKDALKKGFVINNNDMGHNNTLTGDTLSTWGSMRNNIVNKINWAYLSTHLTTVSGKAMVKFYYGTPAKRSLFRGGSTGGRQALVAAARYPHDFDGIITAYGALNQTGIAGLQKVYLSEVSMYPNRTQILSSSDITALNKGALAACDGNDGLVDGYIDLSYRCDFDPIDILCGGDNATSSTNCLSSMDKVTAARGMYGYPSNSFSDKLIPVRFPPGSELSWGMWTTKEGVDTTESSLRNLAFQEALPLNWTLDAYDWDYHPYQLGIMEDIYTADFTGLRLFRERGGKIIHYQGWADASVAAGWTVQLYQKAVEEIGLERLTDFHRMFIYPGMAHIDIHRNENGTVGWRTDYFDYLTEWLDTGVAPDMLVIEHWNMTSLETMGKRPYFAYPKTPKYVGGKCGGPSNPANWVGVIPDETERGEDYPWPN